MNDWRTREEAAIKIACIQMEPVIGEKERNVWRSLELIEDAAANGAHLLVLPEFVTRATCSTRAKKRSHLRRSFQMDRPAAVGRKQRESITYILWPESTSVTGKSFTMLQS
jgi:predicted amidohydrolase